MTYMLDLSPARYLKDRDYLETLDTANRSLPRSMSQFSIFPSFSFACRQIALCGNITCAARVLHKLQVSLYVLPIAARAIRIKITVPLFGILVKGKKEQGVEIDKSQRSTSQAFCFLFLLFSFSFSVNFLGKSAWSKVSVLIRRYDLPVCIHSI